VADIERSDHRWSRFAERMTNAFGLVLLLVAATYVMASLTRYSGWSAVGITALASTATAVAFGSSGAGTPRVRLAVAVGAVAVALAILAVLTEKSGFLAAAAVVQMVLLFAAAATVLRAVLSEAQVDFRTILGAISVYLIFGLLFTCLYVAIDRLQPGDFFIDEAGSQTGNFVFFSFTTLTTTGYGNLVPAAQPGKMVAGLEMLFGQIFLVTLIAGLVSLWRPRRR
jgi:Ion channel